MRQASPIPTPASSLSPIGVLATSFCYPVTKLCPTLCGLHRLQHTMLPCPALSPRVYSNSCPWSQWCHPTISSSVTLFSSCPQSFPKSGSFPVSQLFASGSQSIGVSVSASVLPMNIQGFFSPLEVTGLISLLSKRQTNPFPILTVPWIGQGRLTWLTDVPGLASATPEGAETVPLVWLRGESGEVGGLGRRERQ